MKWSMPKIWEGGRCFIIGGGPSMYKQLEVPDEIVTKVFNKELPPAAYAPYFAPIMKEHIIGVNMAYRLGNWVDVVFFGDTSFWKNYRFELQSYHGLKISCSGEVDSVKQIRRSSKKLGITTNPQEVCWNHNSGAAAINLAVHTGVKQIILLGFDMKVDSSGNQHWHKEYPKPKGKVEDIFARHLLGFPEIAKQAIALGVEILNANPDSGIDAFKKVNLKEVL
jgi:hypothetical protein